MQRAEAAVCLREERAAGRRPQAPSKLPTRTAGRTRSPGWMAMPQARQGLLSVAI